MRCLSRTAALHKKAQDVIEELKSPKFWEQRLNLYKNFEKFLEKNEGIVISPSIKPEWDKYFPYGAEQARSEQPYAYHYIGQYNSNMEMCLYVLGEEFVVEFNDIWQDGVNITNLENLLKNQSDPRQFLLDKVKQTIEFLNKVLTSVQKGLIIDRARAIHLLTTKYSCLLA